MRGQNVFLVAKYRGYLYVLISISGDSASYFLEMIMPIGSVGNKTQTNSIHVLVRGALGFNVSSFFKYFQYRGPCHKEDLLTPHVSFTREVTLPTHYSGLSYGTFQTNKHNHLNIAKG